MRTLPSALSGMPPSSRVRQIIAPPYFAARGKNSLMLSFLPFTEFMSGQPLYLLNALSMATGSEVSICRGKSVTA